MQTGLGMLVTWPVGWRWPVWGWMRKVTMVLVSWLAARSQAPEGSMAKLAMLSWPPDQCPERIDRIQHRWPGPEDR